MNEWGWVKENGKNLFSSLWLLYHVLQMQSLILNLLIVTSTISNPADCHISSDNLEYCVSTSPSKLPSWNMPCPLQISVFCWIFYGWFLLQDRNEKIYHLPLLYFSTYAWYILKMQEVKLLNQILEKRPLYDLAVVSECLASCKNWGF